MTDADNPPARALADDGPTGWFERLYAAAQDGRAVVPWDRGTAHPLFAAWARERALEGAGRRAICVGMGPGEDAELLSGRGFETTAFDVSPTAVRAARARFPGSAVAYETADLLDLPARWRAGFDLVVEVFTVQSMPRSVRAAATADVRSLVAPGGTLLVVASALGARDDPADGPPWPLTRAELDAFATPPLEAVRVDLIEQRWRAELRRTG